MKRKAFQKIALMAIAALLGLGLAPGILGGVQTAYAAPDTLTWQDATVLASVTGLSGDGSGAYPYQISTPEELGYFAKIANTLPAGTYVDLTNDIDLGAHLWLPIGDSTHPFTGHFNGKGHLISNMTITATAGNQGLFGYIGSSGSVTRVALNEPSITITGSGHENAGGIAGYNEGAISNCLVRGAYSGIYTTSTYAGGIAGWNQNGTIDHCVADLSVYTDNSSQGLVGGVTGYNGGASGIIRDCLSIWPPASSDYSATRFVGAIVGRSAGGYVLNNHYTYEDEGDRAVAIYAVGNTGTNTDNNTYLGIYEGTATNWQYDDAFFLDSTGYWSTAWDTGGTDSVWTTDSSSAPIYLQPEDSGGGGTGTPATHWDGDVDVLFDGSGEDIEDPYVITSAAELAGLAQLVNEGEDFADRYFVLEPVDGDAIDLSGYEWVPIGNMEHNFSGHFDGQGNTISGMFIGTDDERNDTIQFAGLFGCADEDSDISDVTLISASIYSVYAESEDAESADYSGSYIGLLAGYTQGEVDKCHVSGTVGCGDADKTSIFAGGLVGCGDGDDANIHDSTADVSVNAGDCNQDMAVGGFIGWLAGGQSTLYNCSSTGEVDIGTLTNEGFAAAGGCAGKNDGSIWNCSATVYQVIGGAGTYLGGFVGYANTGDIDNCYARSHVGSAGAGVGGFVGYGAGGLIQNCYATGNTTGGSSSTVGGFNGAMDESEILICYFNTSAAQWKNGVQTEPAESADGIGMVAADMQNDAFTETLNGNREDIEPSDYNSDDMEAVGFLGWIRDEENNGYPRFGAADSGDPEITPFNPLSNKVAGNYSINFAESTETGDGYTVAGGTVTLTAGVTTINQFLAGVTFTPEDTEYKLFSAAQLSALMAGDISGIYANFAAATDYKAGTDTLDSTTYLIAFNAGHTRLASYAISAGPAEISAPGAPTGVSATAGDGQAIVSFTAPANNGGSNITGYTVRVYLNGVLQSGLTTTGPASPITVRGLTNGTAYTFTVSAANAVGDGTESVASTAVTPASIVVPTVVTGMASGVTASGATLSGSVTSDGGATVTERGFVYGTSANPTIGGSGVWKVTAGSGTGTFSATITGLDKGTVYYARAYAINAEGVSYGSGINFTTGELDGIPDTGDYSLNLLWWILMAVGAAGITTLLVVGRKRAINKK